MDIKSLIILHNSAVEAHEENGVIDIHPDAKGVLMTNKGLEELFADYGNDISRVYTNFNGSWRKHIVFQGVDFSCTVFDGDINLTDLDKEVLEGNLI